MDGVDDNDMEEFDVDADVDANFEGEADNNDTARD